MDPALLMPLGSGLLAVNLGGAVLAVVDKRRAQHQKRRIRESSFHALAFFCAWPGILLAFLAVHHKTRKLRFQVPFVLASATGTAVLMFVLTQA